MKKYSRDFAVAGKVFASMIIAMYLAFYIFNFPIITISIVILITSLLSVIVFRKHKNITFILMLLIIPYVVIGFFIVRKNAYLELGELPILLSSIVSYVTAIYTVKFVQTKKRIFAITLCLTFCLANGAAIITVYNMYNQEAEGLIIELFDSADDIDKSAAEGNNYRPLYSHIDSFCLRYNIMFSYNSKIANSRLDSLAILSISYPEKYYEVINDYMLELRENVEKNGYNASVLVEFVRNIKGG